MENERRGVPVGWIAGACVLVVAGAYVYRFHLMPPAAPASAPAAPAPEAMPAQPPLQPQLPKLEASDALVRQGAQALSSHPKWAAWLQTQDLIRRVAASVSILAEGNSPRAGLDFLNPRRKFAVKLKKGRFYLDPRGYARYDSLAAIVESIDAPAAARLVRELVPIFQEACQEIGCWKDGFDAVLLKAIRHLLDTPTVAGDIRLRKKVVSYLIADPGLEGLGDAQKHLLRMGPANTAKIQAKLREFALAYGFPQTELPSPRAYSPKIR